MKKLTLLFAALLLMSGAAFGQKKTVRDYFLAVPTDYIQVDAKKRAAWIESDDSSIGNLSFNIPIRDITGEDGEGKVFGTFQQFEKKGGGMIFGLATNMCADGQCVGELKVLDFTAGKWTDASEDYILQPDNDEIIAILRKAPAFDKELKDGAQVPLALQFNGNDKSISFIAGCIKDCDGGVVAKEYKWNGVAFVEFEREESPE